MSATTKLIIRKICRAASFFVVYWVWQAVKIRFHLHLISVSYNIVNDFVAVYSLTRSKKPHNDYTEMYDCSGISILKIAFKCHFPLHLDKIFVSTFLICCTFERWANETCFDVHRKILLFSFIDVLRWWLHFECAMFMWRKFWFSFGNPE